MKLTSDNETLAENKALILYVLSKVAKPINNNTLYRLILSIDNINYFYFQQFLLDLIDNKYISTYEQENETLYILTHDGENALNLVKDLIPGILKFKIDNNFKEQLVKIEDEFSISADYTPLSENEYMVTCKLIENNQTLFEVQLYAGSQNQAKSIVDNWTHYSESIYPKIVDILIKKDLNIESK